MWNKPTDKELNTLPKLYETEGQKLEDKLIHMHFFLGTNDWYMAEYSPEHRDFFGYAVLNGDNDMAEWGYINFDELCSLRTSQGFEVDRNLYWEVKKFKEIDL